MKRLLGFLSLLLLSLNASAGAASTEKTDDYFLFSDYAWINPRDLCIFGLCSVVCSLAVARLVKRWEYNRRPAGAAMIFAATATVIGIYAGVIYREYLFASFFMPLPLLSALAAYYKRKKKKKSGRYS